MFVYTGRPPVLLGLCIPRFALAVTTAELGVKLVGAPAALAPGDGAGGRIGETNAPAAASGVRAGMRPSEALALCPQLALYPPDPLAVRDAAERLYRGLEGLGACVEPVSDGFALLDTRPLERLHGGLEGVMRASERSAHAVAAGLRPRLGAAPGRFLAITAARRARPGSPLVIRPDRVEAFLAGLPISALELLDPELRRALEQLGIDRLADLRALGRTVVRDRFGAAGERAWLLASGVDADGLQPRAAPLALREMLALPEPALTSQALQHAVRLLLDRLLARPERAGRAPRSLLLGARLAGGGSWERHVPLREATAERERLELALAPKLAELEAPVDQLAIELCALVDDARQATLLHPAGAERDDRLREAVRQVRTTLGEDAALRVVELDPASRLPERRYALAPHEGS